MPSGVHHLYVESRDLDGSVASWEALGFRLDEGWSPQQRDGILSPVDGSGPYVFLRLAPDDQDELAFQVVFIARLAEDASGNGLHVLFNITLGPSALEPGVTDGYRGTRAFYERARIVPLKELDSWGPDSPGLVLARPS